MKTQDQGFEFSGEKKSEGYKTDEKQYASTDNPTYQFESSSTAHDQQSSAPNYGNSNANKPSLTTSLPYSSGVLVLGILSIVTVCCYGFISIILAIIAIILAVSAQKMYNENPDLYTIGSVKNLNAGKVCAIVGLSIGLLFIISMIIIFLTSNNISEFDSQIQEFENIFENTGY